MTLRILLTAAVLTSSLAQAQTTIFNIPALPASGGTPRPATPSAATPAPTTATPSPVTPATGHSAAQTTLPLGGANLSVPAAASLSGPATVKSGVPETFYFNLTNMGEEAISLQHGACDVRFEVLDAGGRIVRANVMNTLCTMQIVITDVGPGETMDVQAIRWDGRDNAGKALPAGDYTIRSVFSGAGVRIMAEDLPVTVVR